MHRCLDLSANELGAMTPAIGGAAPATVSPLSIRIYRSLWLATIAANIGSCMDDVGAGWLMTSLSPSPLMVALVQAATMLPVALLAMPAGALADIIDRKILLLVAQCAAVLAAIALFAVTASGRVDTGLLLALTFAAACGTALSVPVLQAITSEIVPHSSLAHTVTLGGISNNIARIVGPVAGGLLVAFAGPQWVFLANGVSMLGIIFVIRGWKRKTLEYEGHTSPACNLCNLQAILCGYAKPCRT